MSKESDAKDKEFRRDSYWNKERLEAHAAPHLEFNPEKKPWVGLTDEEILSFGWMDYMTHDEEVALIRKAEAKIKEKNGG
jgi:hypothetical protein